ncbi:spore coat protein GerQ [Alkalihalobacillus hwajinpoensis]|uniref:spore coat protein GerQ n=1 Tax=Guptibacillus hwajinpoensis TaxID=208199 RepID=UPI001883DB92|nr:spore coat protein GerQ [Pseudalkalibacillus hwajinpoensis]MBF0705186.1 spore coat protein GerQ [Pseudalkalibacillus hwajinpoensis]
MMNNQYWNTSPSQNQVGGYGQMPQQGQGGQMAQYPSGYPQGQQVQGASTQGGGGFPGQLPVEQSYIENILRLNLGKIATVYMTFENNEKWNAKVFKGIVEAAGRDHIILSDPQTGKRYILLMVYLDYITFDEELEYNYPLQQTTQYSPR